jgi:DNA-binding transcriptional regulator YiaG
VPTLYARAVRRAAEILGEDELVSRLSVTKTQLRFWMRGAAEPPGDAFLLVADILGEHALHLLKIPREPDKSIEAGKPIDGEVT